MSLMHYDIFLSYAFEDKQPFVAALHQALQKQFKVFFAGERIRTQNELFRVINQGLVKSDYFVMVVSPRYFKKKWCWDELAAAYNRETLETKRIIPIWLDIDLDQVLEQAPILGNRLGIAASEGIEAVVAHIQHIIVGKEPIMLPRFRHQVERTKLYINVWYTPKAFGFWNFWRNNKTGTLFIEYDKQRLFYQYEDKKLYIENIDEVVHSSMSGDPAPNWVKITYGTGQEAWFQAAKNARGIGNLFGGNEDLYRDVLALKSKRFS